MQVSVAATAPDPESLAEATAVYAAAFRQPPAGRASSATG
jgi:hypothetical protein